jgi:hypothetical protein
MARFILAVVGLVVVVGSVAMGQAPVSVNPDTVISREKEKRIEEARAKRNPPESILTLPHPLKRTWQATLPPPFIPELPSYNHVRVFNATLVEISPDYLWFKVKGKVNSPLVEDGAVRYNRWFLKEPDRAVVDKLEKKLKAQVGKE